MLSANMEKMIALTSMNRRYPVTRGCCICGGSKRRGLPQDLTVSSENSEGGLKNGKPCRRLLARDPPFEAPSTAASAAKR
jgi:hypothetical protein